MRKRLLGTTALEVTELGLGTWGLSGDGYGPVAEKEQDRVIERALAVGIRLFDTADCYAQGSMEKRLGSRLKGDASVFIVTKLGTRRDTSCKDFSSAYLREAFERSRERLQRERLDCVLLHNPSAKAFEGDQLRELFESLRSSGALRCWGASIGSVEAGRAALAAGVDVLELPYNMFHTQELTGLETDFYSREVGVLARSVLAHGLLCGLWPQTKDFGGGDHRAERWSRDALRRRLEQIARVRPMLSEKLPSLRAIALRFVLEHARVSSAVLGPRSVPQLDQLVREAGREPPYIDPERFQQIRDRLSEVGIWL